jgi:alpha-amylase
MLNAIFSLLPLLPLLALPASALDASSMRARSVYQVVTDRFALPSNSTTQACSTSAREYCGGTWAGITNKLDYIKGMGFDTLWISPVVNNIGGTTGEGEAYHGYWSLDVSQLNSNFGTATDLKDLATALHAKGMYLMVDIVINHVAATSSSTFTPSSSYGPFSEQDDFHTFCWITDYTNQTMVEQCWLGDDSVALPDLNTESTTVQNYWNSWVSGLVSNYSIDAIRIDTAKHIRVDFWPDFVSSANVFNQAEILDGDATYVGPYQKNGDLNPFNYPVYYPLVRGFNSSTGDLTELVNMTATVKTDFSDPTLLGAFTNNHDNPRFENYTSDSAVSHTPVCP